MPVQVGDRGQVRGRDPVEALVAVAGDQPGGGEQRHRDAERKGRHADLRGLRGRHERHGGEQGHERQCEEVGAQEGLTSVALDGQEGEGGEAEQEDAPVAVPEPAPPDRSHQGKEADGAGERDPHGQHVDAAGASLDPPGQAGADVGAQLAEVADDVAQVARPERDGPEADPGQHDDGEEHGEAAQGAALEDHESGEAAEQEEGRELMAEGHRQEDGGQDGDQRAPLGRGGP